MATLACSATVTATATSPVAATATAMAAATFRGMAPAYHHAGAAIPCRRTREGRRPRSVFALEQSARPGLASKMTSSARAPGVIAPLAAAIHSHSPVSCSRPSPCPSRSYSVSCSHSRNYSLRDSTRHRDHAGQWAQISCRQPELSGWSTAALPRPPGTDAPISRWSSSWVRPLLCASAKGQAGTAAETHTTHIPTQEQAEAEAGTPEASSTPAVASTPEASIAPAVPGTPEASVTPAVSGAPEAPGAPAVEEHRDLAGDRRRGLEEKLMRQAQQAARGRTADTDARLPRGIFSTLGGGGGGGGAPVADPLRVLRLCRQFRYEKETRAGRLVVQPMAVRQVSEVTDLLTDSFEDYLGVFSYRPLLRQQVSVYISQRVMLFPRGITLVGRLVQGTAPAPAPPSSSPDNPLSSLPSPTSQHPLDSHSTLDPPSPLNPSATIDPRSTPTQPTSSLLLPPGAMTTPGSPEASPLKLDDVIVGVAELSLGPPATPTFLTLNPPQSTAYIGNMAVRHAYRRQGIARGLLEAAEALASFSEVEDVHLHCRIIDEAPYRLYESAGYETAALDHRLAPFLTWEHRRRLMRKAL